jgi:hypothetical protein
MHPRTATCCVAPNLASLPRWAPALPHVLQLRTSPPCWGGLRCCHMSNGLEPRLPAQEGSSADTCPVAPGLTSLSRGLRRCHVSHSSGPRLPAGEDSGAAMCPTTFYGLGASSIKKGLASLAMRLGSRVPKACSHASKAPASKQLWPARCVGRRHHYGLQNV